MVRLEREHAESVLSIRNELLSLLKNYSCVCDALRDFMGICICDFRNGLSPAEMSHEICLIAAGLVNHPKHMNRSDLNSLIISDIAGLPDDRAFTYVSLLYDAASCDYYGGVENMTKCHLTFPDHSYPAWLNTRTTAKRLEQFLHDCEWGLTSLTGSIFKLLDKIEHDPLVVDLVLCASDELKQGDLFAAFEKYTRSKERTEYYQAELLAVNLCALYIQIANNRIPYLSPCITPEGLKLLYTTDSDPMALYSGEYKANLSKLEAEPRDRSSKKLCYKYISKTIQPLKNPYNLDLNDLPFTEPLVQPVIPGYTADGPIPRK